MVHTFYEPRVLKTPQIVRERPGTPDASQMFPPYLRCVAGGLDEIPSPIRFFIFYVLENAGRDNFKMLSKKGFQWRHKFAKCGQIVKRSMKIKGPNNLRMEMTKQGETQALQSLIFEYRPTQNRSFNLSTFVPNVRQMAPKGIRN